MKKTKRIFAIIGVIALVALYGSTLVFALIGSEQSLLLLKIAVACTILLPILLYGYTLLYKLIQKNDDHPDDSEQ